MSYIKPFIAPTTYVEPDFELAKNMVDTRQQRYTDTVGAMDTARQQYGAMSSFNDPLKQAQMKNFESQLDEVVKRHHGDLSAASKELTGTISNQAKDPFWHANKRHYQAMLEQEKLSNQMRARGETPLVFNQTRKEDLGSLDSLGNVRVGDPSTFGSDIQNTFDYEQQMRNIWKDVPQTGKYTPLRDYAGMEGFGEYLTTKGIRDSDIQNKLGAAFDTYRNTKEYGQQKRALTELQGLSSEDADRAIIDDMLSAGKLRVGTTTDPRYLREPADREGGSGYPNMKASMNFGFADEKRDFTVKGGLGEDLYKSTLKRGPGKQTGVHKITGTPIMSQGEVIGSSYGFENNKEDFNKAMKFLGSVNPTLSKKWKNKTISAKEKNTAVKEMQNVENAIGQLDGVSPGLMSLPMAKGMYGDVSNEALKNQLFGNNVNFLKKGMVLGSQAANSMAVDPDTGEKKLLSEFLTDAESDMGKGQQVQLAVNGTYDLSAPFAYQYGNEFAVPVQITVGDRKLITPIPSTAIGNNIMYKQRKDVAKGFSKAMANANEAITDNKGNSFHYNPKSREYSLKYNENIYMGSSPEEVYRNLVTEQMQNAQ